MPPSVDPVNNINTCKFNRRVRTGISGEVVFRLPSLAIPDAALGLQASETLKYGAVALFVDRAQAADTHFSLSDNNAPIVAEI